MCNGEKYVDLLEHWSSVKGNQGAVVLEGVTYTYKDLLEGTNRFLSLFAEKGLKKGDYVVSVMRNSPNFISLFYACFKKGLILVPCDTAIDAHRLDERCEMVNASLLLLSDEVAFQESDLKSESCAIAHLSDFMQQRIIAGAYDEVVPVDLDAPLLIAFTSGSTGGPKGAILSARNLFVSAQNIARRLQVTPEDRLLVPLPLSHMFGFVTGLLVGTLAGSCIILLKKFDAHKVLEFVEKEKATILNGVPTMFSRELKQYESMEDKPDLSTLRAGMIAGACVAPALADRIERTFGMKVLGAYGSTETVNVSMNLPEDPLKTREGCAGKIFPTVIYRVVDSKGNEVAPGVLGELLVKGPGCMSGYLNNEIATSQAFTKDGWLKTGDLAIVDEEGYLTVMGRAKDLIIRAGNNVSPQVMEFALVGHPKISAAVVMGAPDPDLGEKIVCFLEMHDDSLSDEDIANYLRPLLPKYAKADEIRRYRELPKLPNGKIDRASLKATL